MAASASAREFLSLVTIRLATPAATPAARIAFPQINSTLAQDYGRAAFDVRHRLFLVGSISMPYQFRLSPFIVASSGSPFNVTTGQDANNDSIFNDRPTFAQFQAALANAAIAHNVRFDCNESNPGTLVSHQLRDWPGRFSFNLRLSKTIGFGKKKETASNAGAGGGMGGGTLAVPEVVEVAVAPAAEAEEAAGRSAATTLVKNTA